MSEYLQNSREYRFIEWLRFTRSRPIACQPIMKNFYQCFDHHRFNLSLDESEAKSKCLEEFNYEECFTENFPKLKENWPRNVDFIQLGGGGDEEDEDW